MHEPAILVVADDGRYLDASEAALELLGVTIDELQAAPPGLFAVEPADPDVTAAFRREWERTGSPQLSGDATIRRGDGRLQRVKFAIRPVDDAYVAILERSDVETAEPPRIVTAGEMLAAWRQAERKLETLDRRAPEWAIAFAETEHFKALYHDYFAKRRDR